MNDVLVIGSGPAGVSAAIYASRAGLNTVIISQSSSALVKAEKIENYYGFSDPITGQQLLDTGVSQAERVGVDMIKDQVVSIGYEKGFSIKTRNGVYKAKTVVIATGSNRTAPRIKGFYDYEGKGISYCAVCDAFFYKGKDIAVLGCCEYALHEALELLPIVKSVTLVTNGVEPIPDFPEEITIIEKDIAAIVGGDYLEGVKFSDGTVLSVSGLFVAIGVAGSSDLARKLGAETEGLKIVVNENMETSIPGLYAAGDCTAGMMQIAKAVYEGAKAGTEAVKFVRRIKK